MAENNALWNWGNQQTYHEKIKQEIEKASTGGVTIDSELDVNSENLIQNKAVAEAIDVLFKNRSIFTDANTCTTMGTHYCATGAANIPFDCYGMLLVYTKDDGAWFIQEFYAIEDPSIHYVRTWVNDAFSDWVRVSDGGDADTLDGYHANEFITGAVSQQLTTSINQCFTVGTYGVEASYTPDFPTGYGTYGLLDVRVYGDICYQTIRFDNNVIIHRSIIMGVYDWTPWQKVNDGGNADTLDGYHRSSMIIPYGYYTNADGSHSRDLNEITYPSSYLAFKDSLNAPPNAAGWGTVLVYLGGTGSVVQLWVDYNGILSFIRSFDGNNWSAWKNVADGGNAATANYAGNLVTTATTSCLRNIAAGTEAATTANCPSGALYGQYS